MATEKAFITATKAFAYGVDLSQNACAVMTCISDAKTLNISIYASPSSQSLSVAQTIKRSCYPGDRGNQNALENAG
jgi:hypothetical protein